MSQSATSLPFTLHRQGILLAPAEGLRYEAGGVLNPTIYLAPTGLMMMYRAVDRVPHNFSRLALASLRWEGDRLLAERLDRFALEPSEPYELLDATLDAPVASGGGCEDPRVTEVDGELYLCYTAYGGAQFPRIAFARSNDGLRWTRLGLARWSLHVQDTPDGELAVDLNLVPNKDAMLFPEKIHGRYAMLHRPMFSVSLGGRLGDRQSIWISYSDDLLHWDRHQLVAAPAHPWENLKLGGGTQPVRTPEGWLIFYHGVQGEHDGDPHRRYSAGAMLLDLTDPAKVLYRSPSPILTPESAEERTGVVSNVVFPTGVLAAPGGGFAVAYGMADRCIGWARTGA
ncbi:MAG TPA: hypothetical protein V6D47_04860 [Oscillatoriaceae cyanobacterium]